MSRVLVTGSDGLLGRHLTSYLASGGYDVLRHSRSGATPLRADLADATEAKRLLNEVKPDVIVNLAALTDVDLCEREPQKAYLSNVRVVENLANWISSSEPQVYLVQVSTDQVYDGVGSHRETDICLSNVYGFSKYAGELAAERVGGAILRTNFFGPSNCPGRTSISDWVIQSLAAGTPITVFGDVSFSPLSLKRLTEMVAKVVEQRESGVFNLGSRDGMSKADFAFSLAKVMDFPSQCLSRGSVREYKALARRPHDMRMDSSHFEHTFRISLPTFNEEIQSMKEAYAYQTR